MKLYTTLILIAVALSLGIIGAVYIIGDAPTIISGGELVNPQQEAQLTGVGQEVIENDTVYIDDERVYISATPHTIAPLQWVTYEIMSKQFSGDIDLGLGFDRTNIRPVAIEKYNPTMEQRQRSYTCNAELNYTTDPKYFWCYEQNANGTNILFEHSFESANQTTKTAYWTENYIDEWKPWNSAFDSINYQVQDVNRWFLNKDIPIVANQSYKFRMKIDAGTKGFLAEDDKYWVVFKKSSDTLAEAVSNDRLYALDPWVGGLDVDLVSYWKLDEGANVTLVDEKGQINFTNTKGNVMPDLEGILVKSVGVDGTTEGWFTNTGTSAIDFGTTDDFSFNVWLYVNDTSGDYPLILSSNALNDPRWSLFGNPGIDTASVRVTTTGAGMTLTSNGKMPFNEWHMITFVRNNSGQDNLLYIDGVMNVSSLGQAAQDANANLVTLFNPNIASRLAEGRIDEIGIWSRKLTPSEITELYNSGAGLPYELLSAPSVVLNSPEDHYNSTSTLVTFNTTVTDNIKVQNVSLFIDGGLDQTDTTGTNGTYIFTKTLTTGVHNWSILAFNNNSLSTESVNRTLNVTIESPVITLTGPADNLLWNGDYQWLKFNWTVGYINDAIENATFRINDVPHTNYFAPFIFNPAPMEQQINTLLYEDGNYNWSVTAYNNNSIGITSDTRYFSLDRSGPNINVTSPTNGSSIVYPGVQYFLNWTVSDLNLDTCWYEYNSTTTYVNCMDNTTTFNYSSGENQITFSANDTLGQTTNNIWTWEDALVVVSETFDSTTVETATSDFAINISYTSSRWTGISFSLYYDGTPYSVTPTGSGNSLLATKSLVIPTIEESYINKSFYWNITLTNATNTFYLLSETNQQNISKVTVSLCGEGVTPFITVNTEKAEDPGVAINATLRTNWLFYSSDGAGSQVQNISYEDLTEENNTWSFCFEPNNTGYKVTTSMQVDAATHAPNFHYLVNQTLTATNTNLTIYLLNDSLATLTELKVLDQSQSPLSDVYVYIQYYDIGTDTFYTVGMAKTSYNGRDLTYLNWYDSLYKMVFFKDDSVLLTVNPFKISETPQIFTLETEPTFEFDKFNDISYNLFYNNETSNFVLTFVKPSTVTTGCLNVYKRNRTADFEICNTCETSDSSTLYCNVASYGNGTFIANFYALGSFMDISTIFEGIGSDYILYDVIGNLDGSALAFMLAGVVMTLFLITPVLGIIGVILGMLAATTLGFQPLGYAIFLGIVIVGGVVAWSIKR